MASREVKYYLGKYYQGRVSDNNAAALLKLLTEATVVPDLRHEIYDLPYHIVQNIITQYEAEEKLKGFVKENTFALDNDSKPKGTLRDEQTIGVAFMYLNGSCLLGDEVGLGKTVEVSGLANIVRKQYARNGKHFSFLFLSEKTSVAQLRDKLIQFTGEYVGLLGSGEQAVMKAFADSRDAGSDYSVVATHAALNSNVFLESIAKHPFDLLVIDETAILRNTGTEIYTNAKAASRLFRNIIALNATPVELTPSDLYNQLDIVDNSMLPTKAEFERTFCKKEKRPFGFEIVGYKNEEIFREAISLRYLGRTRADLGGAYEDNEYKLVVAPMTQVQKTLIKKTSLHQLCCDYPTGVNKRIPYNAETCGKVALLLDILDECNAKEGKALVYVRFKECQAGLKELIEAKGYTCAIINGEVTAKQRGKIITEANEGKFDVILTNIYRAYDLPDFVNCILYTVDPNPQKMVQFEGRITRDVNVVGKRVYMLFTEGVEMAVLKTLQARIGAAKAFTTTGRSLVSEAIMAGDNIERREPTVEQVDNLDTTKQIDIDESALQPITVAMSSAIWGNVANYDNKAGNND